MIEGLCAHCMGDLISEEYERIYCVECKKMFCDHIWVRSVMKETETKAFCMKCQKVDLDSEKIDLGKLLKE
ncbi:hypothetical protein LCGC14_1272100 [marine sediment metagenome]|uniref:Uncharacterized protein n=1 Tax=marine sediment metagenome TaxID=412755 RepID=A0A0F9P0S3_9ZZZZ